MATKNIGFSGDWSANSTKKNTGLSKGEWSKMGTLTINSNDLAQIPDNSIINDVSLIGQCQTNMPSREVEIKAELLGNAAYSGHKSSYGDKWDNTTNSFGSCSYGDLKNNPNIDVYCTRHDVVIGTSCTYKPLYVIITYTFYLDVNGQLDDGDVQGSISPMGVMDVVTSVDSRLNDTDYYNTGLEPGTTYTVNNIKANDGYFYVGEKSFSGSLSQSLTIVLPFITVYPYTINFDGNGNTNEFSAPSATSRIGDDYTIPQNPGFKKEYSVTFNFNGSGADNQTVVSSATMNGWEDWGTITASDNKQYTPENFDAPYYANKYTDLYNAYKYSKQDLVNHWVSNGKSEGLSCTGNPRGIYPFGAVASFMADNGGTTTLKAQWSDMSAITLPDAERDSYEFLGWYTEPKNGEKIGDSGGSYIPSANITLYAHWGCTVTFDGNGGECREGMDTITTKDVFVNEGESVALLKNFNKQYYVGFKQYALGSNFTALYSKATFLGWFTEKESGENIGEVGSSYTPTGNITLYAHWSEMPAIILPEPPFYDEKYYFNGYWNSDNPSNATVKYGGAGDSFVPTKNGIVCISQWLPKKLLYVGAKRCERIYIGKNLIKRICVGNSTVFYQP